MANFAVFAKKELTENLRTKNLLALAIVFLLFAVISPLLARYMGEFLRMIIPDGDEFGAAMLTELPEPLWSDGYLQYFSNLGQVGTITVILVYMSTVLREKRSGTSDLMFTKGLSPVTFIAAKIVVGFGMILCTAITASLVCYALTHLLFGYAGSLVHIFAAMLVLCVFYMMMLGVTVLLSALMKSTALCAVLGLVTYFALAILAAIPRVGRLTPGQLAIMPTQVFSGSYHGDLLPIILIAFVITLLCGWGAAVAAARRQVS